MRKLRILVVHCRYQQRGGEDTVVDAEFAQLKNAGHHVQLFEMNNSDLKAASLRERLALAAQSVWAANASNHLKSSIIKFSPDLVHVHNTFPTLSGRVFHVCAELKVPVVLTLHNYRLLCANAMFLKHGQVCELCIDGQFLHGALNGCYRGSQFASAAVVAGQYVHRALGTYKHLVTRFLVLSQFARSKFVAGGLPAEKLVVKPNSLALDPGEGLGEGGYCLYVGRLSAEKGLRTLMEAWRDVNGVKLKVAGDGPMMAEVRNAVALNCLNVEVLGAVRPEQVLALMKDAQYLIVPSEWYEGFPMTVIESFACGTPVIGARIGTLSEVVMSGRTGEHFEVGNAVSLATVVNRMVANGNLTRRLRESTRRHFLENFTAEKNVAALEKIYGEMLKISDQ